MSKTTFCEECREDTEYTVSEDKLMYRFKGTLYKYTGKKAVCNKCGQEVFVQDVEDFCLSALMDAIDKKKVKEK